MRTLLSAFAVAALAATPVLGHGGQYRGPVDSGSAVSVSGRTVAPPTNPAGATAPGPGVAPGSGSAAGIPSGARTAGRTVRGGSARRSATTGGGVVTTAKGFEIWEFWWENNKHRFLNLKDRLIKNTNVSGSPGQLTGRGRKQSTHSSRRPTRAMINNEVIPALLTIIDQSDNGDILDSAILALGRTAEEDMADQIVATAQKLLAHDELSVQSTAALALGVLGSPRASQLVRDVLQANTNGRRLVGGSDPHWLVRAFSALALGLIADEESVNTLIDIVRRLPDSDKDIKVCAIVGLGLLDAEHPQADDVRNFLSEMLADRKLDALIKSYIPTSIGKLGDAEAVPALMTAFTDRDTDNLVRQSAAIGLGQTATVADNADAIQALIDYIEEGRDQQTRHFCIITLAQIGARDAEPEATEESAAMHKAIVDRLSKEIQAKGKSKEHRSWAALAGALYSRSQEESQPEFVDKIQAAYKKESDPSYRSAFAVALGLLNDQTSAEMIFEDFNSRKEQDFRGYAAIALGFMNHTDAADALRGLCQNKTTTPTLRLQVATGLGLMSDTQAVQTLIETLTSATTLGVSSAVAKALGLIGDQDSIQPLKNIAADDDATKLTRAFACVALGIVGEKTDLPWNAVISANNNYRAKVPSIEEVLDIL